MSVYEALRRLLTTLPKDPIDRKNRRVARLWPSDHVPRGQVYRIAAQPELTGDSRPLIVMNVADVQAMRREWASLPGLALLVDVDQEIADCCEQVFADQAEATTRQERSRWAGINPDVS